MEAPRHFLEGHLSPGTQAGPQLLGTFPTQHFYEATAAQGAPHCTSETCVPGPSLGTKSTRSGYEQMTEVLREFRTSAWAESWMKRLSGRDGALRYDR